MCIFYISIFFRFSQVTTTGYKFSLLLQSITTCFWKPYIIGNTHDYIFIIHDVYWLETTHSIKFLKFGTHKIQKLLHIKINLSTRFYIGIDKKSPRRDSNPQPPDPKSDALSMAPLGLI